MEGAKQKPGLMHRYRGLTSGGKGAVGGGEVRTHAQVRECHLHNQGDCRREGGEGQMPGLVRRGRCVTSGSRVPTGGEGAEQKLGLMHRYRCMCHLSRRGSTGRRVLTSALCQQLGDHPLQCLPGGPFIPLTSASWATTPCGSASLAIAASTSRASRVSQWAGTKSVGRQCSVDSVPGEKGGG